MSEGITLVHDPYLRDADGVGEGGRIRLRAGLSPAAEFATLVHEFAHDRLHRAEDRAAIARTPFVVVFVTAVALPLASGFATPAGSR